MQSRDERVECVSAEVMIREVNRFIDEDLAAWIFRTFANNSISLGAIRSRSLITLPRASFSQLLMKHDILFTRLPFKNPEVIHVC